MEARNISDNFSSLSGNVKEYIRLKLDLYKLMLVEGVTQLVSSVMISLVVLLLANFFLFFLGLAFVYWFGEEVGHMYVGALIMVGFYLLASLLVYIFRDRLFINPIITKLSTFLHEEKHDEEE